MSEKTSSSGNEKDEDSLILYEGKVWHERRQPVVHRFDYTVRYALINLNNPPPWILPIISSNHMNASQVQAIAGTNGPVYLLTMPTSVGYEQNPLSVYYCYDVEGTIKFLRKCIAEVTNTPWGERVSFVFDPNSDLVAKPLHVSPFMDMLGNWKMHASLPGSSLALTILVQHPEFGNYFTATLQAKKVEQLIVNPEIFLWLMPHKVAIWIYWQALQLWWKGVPFVSHPKYSNGNSYRDQALQRDSQLQSAPVCGQHENLCQKRHETFSQKFVPCLNKCNTECGRWFVWRDARWPWS
ncbi:hypothetical protein SUGI_1146840 [Cryptomeria japonica]|nr:hypothetical protein SUGI_1146840 [Cryptomeria japonica]